MFSGILIFCIVYVFVVIFIFGIFFNFRLVFIVEVVFIFGVVFIFKAVFLFEVMLAFGLIFIFEVIFMFGLIFTFRCIFIFLVVLIFDFVFQFRIVFIFEVVLNFRVIISGLFSILRVSLFLGHFILQDHLIKSSVFGVRRGPALQNGLEVYQKSRFKPSPGASISRGQKGKEILVRENTPIKSVYNYFTEFLAHALTSCSDCGSSLHVWKMWQ